MDGSLVRVETEAWTQSFRSPVRGSLFVAQPSLPSGWGPQWISHPPAHSLLGRIPDMRTEEEWVPSVGAEATSLGSFVAAGTLDQEVSVWVPVWTQVRGCGSAFEGLLCTLIFLAYPLILLSSLNMCRKIFFQCDISLPLSFPLSWIGPFLS